MMEDDLDLNGYVAPIGPVSGRCSPGDSYAVYFRDLKQHMIRHIEDSELVLGCMAWLVDHDVVAALAQKEVALVIQKEDFLRPDKDEGEEGPRRARIRQAYGLLKNTFRRSEFRNKLNSLDVFGKNQSVRPVSCCGFRYEYEPGRTAVKMHHKFLVFAERVAGMVVPRAVLTGSYNPTMFGNLSLENMLYVTNPDVREAYYQEFGEVYAISEPLDWRTEYVNPRI